MRYEDETRGKIQNPEQKRQLMDFSGLRYGKITPTDIDGFIEMSNKLFIFYEFKNITAKQPYGQQLAETNLIDALRLAGKEAAIILCRHSQNNFEQEIDAANCTVEKYYYDSKWYNGNNRTAKEVTDSFISYAKFA